MRSTAKERRLDIGDTLAVLMLCAIGSLRVGSSWQSGYEATCRVDGKLDLVTSLQVSFEHLSRAGDPAGY